MESALRPEKAASRHQVTMVARGRRDRGHAATATARPIVNHATIATGVRTVSAYDPPFRASQKTISATASETPCARTQPIAGAVRLAGNLLLGSPRRSSAGHHQHFPGWGRPISTSSEIRPVVPPDSDT